MTSEGYYLTFAGLRDESMVSRSNYRCYSVPGSNTLTTMANPEKIILLNPNTQPTYVFENSVIRKRKRQLKNFQCCICVILIFGIIAGLVIAASYSLNDLSKTNSTNNETNQTELAVLKSSFYHLPMSYNETAKYKESIDAVKSDVAYRELLDKLSPKLDVDSPSYRHQMVTATSNKSLLMSRYAYIEELATIYYRRNHKTNSKLICANITTCTSNVTCSGFTKYRSYDGQCNNIKSGGAYGAAYRPFRRILPPDYADAVSQPRISKDGTPLPSARLISTTIHRPYFRNDPKFTVMLAVWGQFLDHDITATALSRKQDGSSISCCATLKHPECFPVPIAKEDPYYGRYNVTCMEFVRSAPAPTCCLGPRQQINQVSSYIDGSVVYGSDEITVTKLRTKKNGELKMLLTSDNRTLLPVSDDINDGCNREDQRKLGRYCFMSGDARANENLHLTSMHLIWARQHNLLAKNLTRLNPDWNDERVFQEARRILIGQIQHVTYNEFLRIILGEELLGKHDLKPRQNGFYHGYDASVDATIANSFASAAFRFAHSLIPTLVRFIGKDEKSSGYIKLHEILFDPFLLYEKGELEKVLKGASYTQMQANDQFFSPELKNHLFERDHDAAKTCGLDLVSLNIQRGRDHGLPGYVNWRGSCSLPRANTFNQLTGDIDAESLNYIQSIYSHVEDVDLYTGALSEKPTEGSILGPTLNCMILDQFIRLKKGDRFWYENPGVFSQAQLNEIRKTTLAGVLCENSQGLNEVQPYVMRQRADENEDVPCSNLIGSPDLSEWKENSFTHVAVSSLDLAVESL